MVIPSIPGIRMPSYSLTLPQAMRIMAKHMKQTPDCISFYYIAHFDEIVDAKIEGRAVRLYFDTDDEAVLWVLKHVE